LLTFIESSNARQVNIYDQPHPPFLADRPTSVQRKQLSFNKLGDQQGYGTSKPYGNGQAGLTGEEVFPAEVARQDVVHEDVGGEQSGVRGVVVQVEFESKY
jgi:hypothetical protein